MGGIFKLNTLGGVITHKFPSGLKHNEHYKIKGLGLPKPYFKDKGDLFLMIKIIPPNGIHTTDIKQGFQEIYKKVLKNKV